MGTDDGLRLRQIKHKGPWIAYYKGHEGCVAEAKSPWQALDKLRRLFPAYKKAQERLVTTVEQAESIEKEARLLGDKHFYPCGHLRTIENSMVGKWRYKRCKQCHYETNNRNRLLKRIAEAGVRDRKADELIEGYYTNERGGLWLKAQLRKLSQR